MYLSIHPAPVLVLQLGVEIPGLLAGRLRLRRQKPAREVGWIGAVNSQPIVVVDELVAEAIGARADMRT